MRSKLSLAQASSALCKQAQPCAGEQCMRGQIAENEPMRFQTRVVKHSPLQRATLKPWCIEKRLWRRLSLKHSAQIAWGTSLPLLSRTCESTFSCAPLVAFGSAAPVWLRLRVLMGPLGSSE